MTGQSLSSRAVVGEFFLKLKQYMGSSWVALIAMYFTSDQESEEYKWLGMVPQMREWLGSRQAKGLREQGMTIRNKEFESTLDVPKRWLRRDKTGQLMIRIAEQARRAGGHWAELLSTLITNGTGSTSGLCYDGQYFFDDDHSEGDSGTQKNLLTNAEVPALDVATATAPTAAEAAKAILGVIAYMLCYKDDQGKPMNVDARNFLVMTSPILWSHLCGGILNPVAGGGDTNSLKALLDQSDFNVNVVPNPYLAYTTQFATFRTDAATKPFIMQEEVPLNMSVLGEGSDHAFKEKAYQYGVDATRNVGYGLWQHAAHATLS